jgi:hypothetical protein
MGIEESRYLRSVVRGAAYIIIAALSGMRDSEIQALKRGASGEMDGLPALESTEYKGRQELAGVKRAWWAPAPVARAMEVLEATAGHSDYLLAPSSSVVRYYDCRRDIQRVIAFVNDDPSSRVGRGKGLGLSQIDMRGSPSINATTLRRSYSVFVTTKAGAELGLGMQLGHASLRMTSGYMSDGQEKAVVLMNSDRVELLSAYAHDLIFSDEPIAGEASQEIANFRAQVISDPGRSAAIVRRVAGRLHLGLTNDCMYNADSAGCGPGGPHLADHLCTGPACANALFHQPHLKVLTEHLGALDAAMSRPGHPEFQGNNRRQWLQTKRIVDELSVETEIGRAAELKSEAGGESIAGQSEPGQ